MDRRIDVEEAALDDIKEVGRYVPVPSVFV
jgi:hypothetical protein